jgi:hypothetical protein
MTFVKDIQVPQRDKRTVDQKKAAREELKKQWQDDSKLVKGVFHNVEAPGGDVKFAYKEYAQDPIRVYTFKDGESYTIPLGVAKHINRQCKYKKHKHLIDKDGNQIKAWDKPTTRYQFVSDDYM